MKTQKQIFFLENPGLSRALVTRAFKDGGIPHGLIWDPGETDPEQVEYLVTVKEPLPSSGLERYPNLKMVAVAFTGYDSVDLDHCRNHNIAVYNVPAYSTNAVVELALGLTLSLLREIPLASDLVHSGGWDLRPGLELNGRTVGIVGTGTIGMAAARVFKAFGCGVIGWSRSQKAEFTAMGGSYVPELTQLFSQADIVSVHLPLNEGTRGIISAKELGAMKDTAFLVNTARGPLVDEKELIKILKGNKIAGAGLDVFHREPLEADSGLLALDNVVLTPHIAFKTEEAIARRVQVTLGNIKGFMDHNDENRVDGAKG